ncbi:unnamed protein product [Nippostrongylus brasiliensis]|uniref:SH3 domain-containing protein n=1 Tax=Nippostrongylus brasiliensis TaxID=27835 RepID=A0A158QX19_NIPBR|nr:unnamed protein product [Nippostrongylus brasiliensis]
MSLYFAADHVLLRLADLSDDPPIFITVRTRTREGAVSCDSNVARVPRGPVRFGFLLLGFASASVYPSVSVGLSRGCDMPADWKTSQMKQYYTFHPRLIRGDGTAADEPRPSVPDMENSYLLRHRHSDWGGHSEWAGPMDARMRVEAYARQTARAGSAEDRPPARHSESEERKRFRNPKRTRLTAANARGRLSMWRYFRFVALFDYSHHMSPNANAEADELSFRKHQLIKVYGEVDADGFYHGQIGNRVGLVPSNMVIEIAKDDLLPRRTRTDAVAAEPALRRMRWGSLKSRSYDHAGDRRTHDRPPTSSHFASLDRREMERREASATRSDRYRRSNGRDYEYRRDYDDRYRELREPRDHRDREREMRDHREPRVIRDDYHRDYRDEEDYRAENINGVPTKKMVAKFDYDSRQLSPNVDAEQVELSFRQGDIITVYGEMDDDGFYMGELNGLRGLVPSNFLQSSPLTTLAPSQPTEPMRKGVAFSDAQAVTAKKMMPARQMSQTSSVAPTTTKPTSKKSTAAAPGGKPLAKKTSDVGKTSAPNVRKTSTAVKKGDASAKVNIYPLPIPFTISFDTRMISVISEKIIVCQ